MKIKFYCLLAWALVTGTVQAQVQLKPIGSTTDNFTSFTPAKIYTDVAKLKAATPAAFYNHPDFGTCVAPNTQWYEQLDKRTLKSRTYMVNNTTTVMEYGYGNINYTDENGWMRAIDTKLKPCAGGWAVTQQEVATYLYTDGSTALSLGNGQVITFNKNAAVNSTVINTAQYTVGDNGMLIKNAANNTDKIIRFGRDRIETDYKINQPLSINGDLVISEDVVLPGGFTISNGAQAGTLVVSNSKGDIQATFKVPVCYDKNNNRIKGTYQIQQQQGGYRVSVNVPSAWINNSARQYPVTIDPVVVGQVSLYTGNVIPSCYFPDYGSGSISLIVPAKTTITNFYIQAEFYAASVLIAQGAVNLVTSCSSTGWQRDIQDSAMGGIALTLQDWMALGYPLSCCVQPSCSPQAFNLTMELSRVAGDTTCDSTELFYDPANDGGYPFEAYLVGHTVEAVDSSWSLTPSPFCENTCNITLNTSTFYGVPPYTISHPWATGSITYGGYAEPLCTSVGDTFLTLTIPVCSDTASNSSKVSVAPPIIVDACNDTVKGLKARQVTLNPAPHAAFGYHQVGHTVTFYDSSAREKSWKWEFGDGGSNTNENPVYVYNSDGNYTVTLVVTNGVCTDSATEIIPVTAGIAGVSGQNSTLHIYPNPASNTTMVQFISSQPAAQLTVVNVLGQTLYSETLKPAVGNTYRTNLDVSELPAGIYDVVITTPVQSMAKEIIKPE